MTQYGFYFDQSRCYGCQACSVACKDWNGLNPGPEKWMSVYDWETGVFPDIRINLVAFPCGHCADPACAKACPEGAIFKEDTYGAVLVDSDKCTGHRDCFEACPYGSPKFASDELGEKMTKCTMCIDRLERGEKPVCVLSCPLRALDFGPMTELRAKYGNSSQLPEMPDPSITHPNWVATPHRPRQEFVPLDPEKVRQLSQERDGMGLIFAEMSDLTDPAPGLVRRNKLRMKNATAMEVMANTKNDLG